MELVCSGTEPLGRPAVWVSLAACMDLRRGVTAKLALCRSLGNPTSPPAAGGENLGNLQCLLGNTIVGLPAEVSSAGSSPPVHHRARYARHLPLPLPQPTLHTQWVPIDPLPVSSYAPSVHNSPPHGFPTFCATLVGGATLLPLALQSVLPKCRWGSAQLLAKFVTTFVSAWAAFTLLNRRQQSCKSPTTTISHLHVIQPGPFDQPPDLDSGELHALTRFWKGRLFAARMYAPLQLIVLLRHVKRGRRAHRLPGRTRSIIGRSMMGPARSSAFLGTSIALFYYGVCLSRTRIGPRLFSSRTITPQIWDSGLCVLGGCLLCEMSILVEHSSKRLEMILFVLPRAAATWCPRRYLPEYQWREHLAFALSAAVVLAAAQEDPKGDRGVLGNFLNTIVG